MSLRYLLTKHIMNTNINKDIYTLVEPDLLREVVRINKDRDFKIPKDKRCVYSDVPFLEVNHCLRMQKSAKASDHAILYLCGGGMFTLPDETDLKVTGDLCLATGRDVWMPYLPILTVHTVDDVLDGVFEIYSKMLENYDADKISVMGLSSGASLLSVMCLMITRGDYRLELPEQIIAISPDYTVTDPDLLWHMQQKSAKDVRIDMKYVEYHTSNKRIWGEDLHQAKGLFSGFEGDYSRMPATSVYYGGDEIFSEMAETIKSRYKEAGRPLYLHIEKGVMNCYPVLTFCPEGKKAFEEITKKLMFK